MPIYRILGLCVSFAVVIFAIYKLNDSSFEKSSFGALFVSQSFEIDSSHSQPQNWTWCHTRVTHMRWEDLENPKNNYHIHQEKMKWVVDIGEKINMAQVGMELWLARNCTVQLEALGDSPMSRIDYKLSIEFIDGKQIQLSFAKAGNLMSWNDQSFRSPSFLAALLQLPFPPQEIQK